MQPLLKRALALSRSRLISSAVTASRVSLSESKCIKPYRRAYTSAPTDELGENTNLDASPSFGIGTRDWKSLMKDCREVKANLGLSLENIEIDRAERRTRIAERYHIPEDRIEDLLPPNGLGGDTAYDLRLMGRNAWDSASSSNLDALREELSTERAVFAILGAAGTSKTSTLLSLMHPSSKNPMYIFYTNFRASSAIADPLADQVKDDVQTSLVPVPQYDVWKDSKDAVKYAMQYNNAMARIVLQRDLLARQLLLHLLLEDGDVTPTQFRNAYFSKPGSLFIQEMYGRLSDYDPASVRSWWSQSNRRMAQLRYPYAVVVDEADVALDVPGLMILKSFDTMYRTVVDAAAMSPQIAMITSKYKRGLLKAYYDLGVKFCPLVVIGTNLRLSHLYFAGSDFLQPEQLRVHIPLGVLDQSKAKSYLQEYPVILEGLDEDAYTHFWKNVRPRITEVLVQDVCPATGPLPKPSEMPQRARDIEVNIRKRAMEMLQSACSEYSLSELCALLSRSHCLPDVRPFSGMPLLPGQLEQRIDDYRLFEFGIRAGLPMAVGGDRNIVIAEQQSIHNLAKCISQLQCDRNGATVLSMDGGGARVVIGARVLKKLQDRLGGVPISSLFDIVVGTSGGGILAMSILLGLQPDDMLELLVAMGDACGLSAGNPKEMLKDVMSWSFHDLANIATFPSTRGGRLQEIFAGFVGKSADEINAELMSRASPHTLITSLVYNKEENEPKVKPVCFSNKADVAFQQDLSVGSVAATSSILNSIKFVNDAGEQFIDGGYWINNPSPLAFEEAVRLRGGFPSLFLSLGSGRTVSSKIGTFLARAGSVSATVATDPENAHVVMESVFAFQKKLEEDAKVYYRVNPDLKKDLEDCVSVLSSGKIIRAASDKIDAWLDSQEVGEQLDIIAKRLRAQRRLNTRGE